MSFLKNLFGNKKEQSPKSDKEKTEQEKSEKLAQNRKLERELFIRNSLKKLIPNNQPKDKFIEEGFSTGDVPDIINSLADDWKFINRESMFEYENRNIGKTAESTANYYLHSHNELIKSIPSYEVNVMNFLNVTCLSLGLYAYKRERREKFVD